VCTYWLYFNPIGSLVSIQSQPEVNPTSLGDLFQAHCGNNTPTCERPRRHNNNLLKERKEGRNNTPSSSSCTEEVDILNLEGIYLYSLAFALLFGL